MKLLSHIKSLYSKYSRLLPWASLIWGIGSSFWLTRDYDKANRLGFFTLAFFLLIIIMSTWYSYITKISLQSHNKLTKIHINIHKQKDLLEFVGLTATQYFIQYIFMFCLPFLYFKQEWIWLFFLSFFVGMTLWDPFWVRLFKIQIFRLFLRLISSCMAFGFLYAVLFPKFIDYYYVWFTVVCFFVIFPWNSFVINRKIKIQEIAASFILTIIIAIHSFIPSEYQFPVISIWVENSNYSIEKPSSNFYELIKGNIRTRKEFLKTINSGKQICAISPIIAPSGFYSRIYHEWYVDDILIDRITLPNISGSDIKEKHNTYSCKKYFLNMKQAKKITTKIYLKNGIYVGKQFLIISD